MCYSADSSLAGFVGTWSLCLVVMTMQFGRPMWKYNLWTGAAMMTVAIIQLLEFNAWNAIDDPPARQSVAQLIKPTLLLQPAVNCMVGAYVLGLPWLFVVGAGYLAWSLASLANPQPRADIERGSKGHLAWYGDAPAGSFVLTDGAGTLYMVGLFAPLACAIFFGDAAYGTLTMSTLALTFCFSLLMYPRAEASSLWCFWGLLYTAVGAGYNFA